MTELSTDLADYGWNTFFQSQLDLQDLADGLPLRVMTVHRGALGVAGPGVDQMIPALPPTAGDEEAAATVGDWLLAERDTLRPLRLLARRSLFKRRAAGAGRKLQLIAANVDTLFIVTSCNLDFNPARLERYLTLAREADVTPVIVLTKADLTETPEDFVRPATALMPGLLVEPINARDAESAACLSPWCARGQTVALVGSSGVGKSTLINTLTDSDRIATQAIRDDDDKGRHTTSARTMHRMPAGGWLVDTPGMRELQLTDVNAGIDDVFADLVELAGGCKFNDCRHESEPGCAVRAALEAGELEVERLRRWRKLAAEEARNAENLAERRARDRTFGKMVRTVMRDKRAQEEE